ncbi:MAG: NUDIX domain-containing protein, partial [bacterium]|nr:NUDIX domain-containing protein [bacterium]
HNSGGWDFPGGKVDPGESFDVALHREIREETGLAVTVEHPLGVSEASKSEYHIIYLFMSGHLNSGDVKLSFEHDDFRWVTFDELERLEWIEPFRKVINDLREKRMIN